MIGDVEKVARACEEEGISLCMMADVFDVKVARMSLAPLGTIPLLTFDPVARDEGKLVIKRLIDLAVVSLALPVVLPVIASSRWPSSLTRGARSSSPSCAWA